MDFVSLKVFKAVADAGSVSQAAVQLHYVQSNVTARIQRLEEDVGAKLFSRSQRGMRLTPAGETLMAYANRATILVGEAYEAVAATQAGNQALRLGSLETILAVHFPDLLHSFYRQHPGAQLQLVTGATDRMVSAVLEFKVDGAFVAGVVEHPNIVHEKIFNQEIVLVTPLDMHDRDAPVAGSLLVFHPGCPYRSVAEQWLKKKGRLPERLMELSTLDGILTCVGVGLGVTMLPRSAVERPPHHDKVRIHSLDDADAKMDIHLIRRRNAPAHPLLSSFRALVKSAYG